MDNRPIGVFDSGVGGLTVVKELHRLMPFEDIVYFGDTGRVPYGSRSRETIVKYGLQDIQFLRRHNVKMIVAACGTVSSNVSDDQLAQIGLDIPYTGVVLPATQAACAATQNGKIGVLATKSTIRSHAFAEMAGRLKPEAQVFEQSGSLLVPLAENAMIEPHNPITRLTLQMYLEPLIQQQVDTLILGCTHFPLFFDSIAEIMGENVKLIDSGAATAHYVRAQLAQQKLLNQKGLPGTSHYYVTDTVETFEEVASIFLQKSVCGKVEFVNQDVISCCL